MTLFMAGHETTANTLAWAWFLLLEHPEVEARLHAELDGVLGEPAADFRRPATTCRTPETSSTRPCAFIPRSGWWAARISSRSSWAAITIPVGTTVFMPQWVIHRDRPLVRRPRGLSSRALGGRSVAAAAPLCLFPVWRRAEDLHRQQFRPDGSGAAAGHDAQSISAAACPRRRIVPLPTMTLRPAHGVKVMLTKHP